MPLSPYFAAVLRNYLTKEFVPQLPPLLQPSNSAAENEKKNWSRAFSAYVLCKLCGIDIKRACGSVIDDFGDSGIDALFCNGPTLYVIQSKFKESETLNEGEALKLINGLNKIVSFNFTDANAHLQAMQSRVEKWLTDCDHIQIVISTTGAGISRHAKVALDEFVTSANKPDGRIVDEIFEIGSEKIVEFLISGQSFKRVDVDLFISDHGFINSPYETIFGVISIKNLVDIHKEHGVSLYQRNIRTYLGLRQKQGVNESIQKTLLESPERFFYLNNGITALYETQKEKQKKDGLKRFAITGLSVINGAQTISTAAMSGASEEDLQRAKVMITLVKASADAELGRAVTKARNHQNPVNISDFIALEEVHERLRQECALSDIIYRYKTGEAQSNLRRVINASQAVQALALSAGDPRYPIWLKKEPNTIYNTDGSRYKVLFPDSISGVYLINATLIDRIVASFLTSNINSTTGIRRLIYKHGQFVLAWVFMKQCRLFLNCGNVLDEVAVTRALSAPFDEMRELFHDETFELVGYQGQPGPLAFFKNLTRALPHTRSFMVKAFGLDQDPVVGIKLSQQDPPDSYPNAAAFDYITSKAPQIELPR